MSDHLPECLTPDPASPEILCICDRLRACEQRVYDERNEAWVKKCRASERHALDAARDAVATRLRYQEFSWGVSDSESGDWIHRSDALDAIDALRGES